ncbi:hypothetical protein M4914_08095 [Streptomyces somaliensis DSM 40738]|uniref:Uncharacterized protein n=1 Tax=Streptomyces somaliensis (strain ATCC 33201 / DSM 40738 / JCM 12659 / KCTC 9044 / NCTC 11332 / NRRL B-12077 / IP 733) TaxID=1134445 RepID=A0AA44DCK7_STRE0|nr:hypothetical protein [Streptomyces somaliensis]MCQ0022918.1 hypothetical protein [Streptomyces somaliensis DSM 40738]NKY14164.1 hypothetical protein [Streptomyces somaliensis DSM 40738]
MTSSCHPDDDRGCLRLVLAVPLGLLTLIAAFFCRTALTIRPSGSWDDEAYAGIVLSCVLAIGAAIATTGLWLLPSVRRVIGWWWVAPAAVFGIVAGVRWGTGG